MQEKSTCKRYNFHYIPSMSIYRRGKRWWVNVERGGVRVQMSAGTKRSDARTYETMLRKLLQALAEGARAEAYVMAWVNSRPARQRSSLAAKGLLDSIEPGSAHIWDYVDQWRRSMLAGERSEAHVDKHVGRVTAILRGTGANTVGRINAAKVSQWLAEQRKRDRDVREKNFHHGVSTSNHYIVAIKQFCNWLVEHGGLEQNPLSRLKKMNANPDIRKRRRAIPPSEIARLVATVEKMGKGNGKLDGLTRALVYRLAFATALRAIEIRTLAAGAIRHGFVIKARYAKARVERQVYCGDASLLRAVAAHIQGLDDDERPFPLPNAAGAMFGRDARAAGIFQEGDDFHTLRHSAATEAAKRLSAADMKVFLGVTSAGIVDRYTHPGRREEIEAALSQNQERQ